MVLKVRGYGKVVEASKEHVMGKCHTPNLGSAAWMPQIGRRVRHVVVVNFVMWHDPTSPC